jgi:hypothetical protein
VNKDAVGGTISSGMERSARILSSFLEVGWTGFGADIRP